MTACTHPMTHRHTRSSIQGYGKTYRTVECELCGARRTESRNSLGGKTEGRWSEPKGKP